MFARGYLLHRDDPPPWAIGIPGRRRPRRETAHLTGKGGDI